jgi:hypothetical protein
MGNIFIVTTLVIMSGFCLNYSGNIPLNGCNIYQEYSSSFTSFFNKVYAKSYWNANSTFDASEKEESLGKIIGQCYLDPLCFKLPIPENESK